MLTLYFDPGLGAMIIQGLVATIAGIVVFSKNSIRKVKSFFRFGRRENKKDSINHNFDKD